MANTIQRSRSGRWEKGSSGNSRTPRNRKERQEKFYVRMTEIVTMDEWDIVVMKALEMAQGGDWRARKWLGDYLMSPPPQLHEHLALKQEDVRVHVIYDKAKPAALEAPGEDEVFEIVDVPQPVVELVS